VVCVANDNTLKRGDDLTKTSEGFGNTPGADGVRPVAGKRSGSEEQPLRVRVSKGRPARNAPATNDVIRRVTAAAKRAAAGSHKTAPTAGAKTHRAGRGAGVQASVGHRQQRVTVKARVQPSPRHAATAAMQRHVDYIQRHGVDLDGGDAKPFDASGALDRADTTGFVERTAGDRHSFRFIVSPEGGSGLELEGYTRDLLTQMRQDLGTQLDWMAVAHHDTDNPHVHVLVRGVDDAGGDLVISRDYISNGMRERARELATRELGYRTDIDIYRAAAKEVQQARWTGLDAALVREQNHRESGLVEAGPVPDEPFRRAQRDLKLGRLAVLREHGLATEHAPGRWKIHDGAQDTLKAMATERRVASQLKPHLDAEQSVQGQLQSKDTLGGGAVRGLVLDRGLADALSGTEYVIVGGFDGRVHYTSLSIHSERHAGERARIGDAVRLSTYAPPASSSADRNVLRRLDADGVYDPATHLAEVRGWNRDTMPGGATPEAYIEAHVRRVEALASRGHVERLPDGRFCVPPDLANRIQGDPALGRDKTAFVRLDVEGRGALFLDVELTSGQLESLQATRHPTRSQAALLEALEARTDRLAQLRLAERTPQGVRLTPGFAHAMRQLELTDAQQRLASVHGQPVDLDAARRFQGRVMAIEQLGSGPHAVIAADGAFAVVPAKDGLQRQLGNEVSVQLARGESINQAFQSVRLRFVAMDLLDKGRALGLGSA
jgi:type IV secretory pathway VirD2 relaxase